MSSTIDFKGTEIEIEITYKKAMFEFKKLGVNLLNIFEDESTMVTILTNDEVMLNIWYHYTSPYCESFEKAIGDITPEMLNDFRNKFWSEVVNFTNPSMRKALMEFKKMILKELQSVDVKLKEVSSKSLPTQE